MEMIYSLNVQVRGNGAKYPALMSKDIEADSPELAIVLGWEWARRLKSPRGPHRVLGVVIPGLET